jgi:ribosome-binding factor A
MANLGTKPPTQRQLRVGEVVRQALAEAFMRGEVYIPGTGHPSITVSEVRVSPDLKNATAYISPLGAKGDEAQRLCEALMEVADEIRRAVGKKLRMKFSPRLRFRVDETFEIAHRVHTILRSPEVARDVV